jgi:glyoxylase-like metal-dependent hydrolase (beta-lactamase superfamily II)
MTVLPRLHHLNCGTLKPIFPPVPGICYCALLETPDGLILVDSALGTRDYLQPTLPVRVFTAANRMPCDVEETAVRRVEQLGFQRQDVRHIVMTHLHIDHAGGLPDFPEAQVHVHRLEYEAALHPHGWLAPIEYIPQHWAHGPQWQIHAQPDGNWFGFDSIRVLNGSGYEVLLVPLPGHTPGHCGVAVRTGERWLFAIGDGATPFYNPEWERRYGPPPAWLVQFVAADRHVARLKALWRDHGEQVQFMFSHDVLTFVELQQHGLA